MNEENRSLPVEPLRVQRDVHAAMRLLEEGTGTVYLAGIGGVGMAGLAMLLAARGFRVMGSDLCMNPLVDSLKQAGITVFAGHDAAQVPSHVSALVRSTAVSQDNPEVARAVSMQVPVFQRGTMLAALASTRDSVAVTGTHGKTTTSAMLAHVFRTCGVKVAYGVGGVAPSLGTVADEGTDPLIVEADESDGTVALYHPQTSIVTNIEYDHMEHFDSREAMEDCFRKLAKQTRGTVFYCVDDSRAAAIMGAQERSVAYGLGEKAVVRGVIRNEAAEETAVQFTRPGGVPVDLTLPLAGRHNVCNALAAWGAACAYDVDPAAAARALESFKPVARRFEITGTWQGMTIVSDYAHHPTEIRGALAMARRRNPGRIIAVFQPHRYTRTRALGALFPAAFDEADEVLLLPVYAASEEPVQGGRSEDLIKHFEQHRDNTHVALYPTREEAWQRVREMGKPGDLVMIVGAGDVDEIARWATEEA